MSGPPAGPAAEAPLIFLVAGEPSGDQLGAGLMAALREETGGQVRFAGVGGERMTAAGLDSLFPIDELAVMGLVEVLPRLAAVIRRIRQTVAAARQARPAVLVTIDSPNFTLEVSRRLAGAGIRLVHYVAPSVWAWKPWRARRVAKYLDHLMVLLPFEPPYFERHGLATTFVGHPALEQRAGPADGAGFRGRHGIAGDAPALCILPGSRQGEVRRLLPIFAETVTRLRERIDGLAAVVPTVPTVAETVAVAVRDWPVPVTVVRDAGEKPAAFAACDAALAASGTVAVELAVAGVPTVLAYRVNWLTGAIVRQLVTVRFVSLVNLVLDRAAQPEFLQGRCRADLLADAVMALLRDPAARARQLEAYGEAVRALRAGDEAPSRLAARTVLAQVAQAGAAGVSSVNSGMKEVS